jgi:hypothetical protein
MRVSFVNMVGPVYLALVLSKRGKSVDAIETRLIAHEQIAGDTITASSDDPFALEDQVAESLVGALQLQLGPQEKKVLTQHDTAQPPAYDYYLQGRGYLEDFQNPETVGNAIVEFNRALQYETNYALALSGLGEAYWRKCEQTKDAELVRQASLHASVPFNWTTIRPQHTFAWDYWKMERASTKRQSKNTTPRQNSNPPAMLPSVVWLRRTRSEFRGPHRPYRPVTPDPVLALFLLAFRDHMICYWLHYCGDGNRTLGELLLAREMVHHIRVLAILAPSPAFRDVVPVFKLQHHLVLMPNRDAGEIGGAQEREGQLLYVPGGWHCAHMRLIVGRAIVLQRIPSPSTL